MTREEELKAEIARLQAELNQESPSLICIGGKPAKIITKNFIGMGTNSIKGKKKYERQYQIPVVVVSEA